MDVATLRGHVDVVNTLDESPHADVWVTGSDDFDVRLWDISKETCLAALEGHSYPVKSVRFFPNFSMIASGSSNGKVRIWGLEWEVSRQRLF
jgi:WD40 repeat protein